MSENKINKDIQTRADWNNMIYANHDRQGNNAKYFHEDMTWYKTNEQTDDLPKKYGHDETNVGMLITFRNWWKSNPTHQTRGIWATQYFFPAVKGHGQAHTGKIYVRFGNNVGYRPGGAGGYLPDQVVWDNWQEVKGAKGDKGLDGAMGPQGIQGPQGLSVQVKGFITNQNQLYLKSNSQTGDCWIKDDNKEVFMRRDTGDYNNNSGWTSLGVFRGIQGPQGPVGPAGATADLTNYYSHNNNKITGSIDNYKELGSRKTENITGLPNNHGSGYGTIIYIPEHYDSRNTEHKGYQIFSSTTHKALYYRSSNESGAWQDWNRISTDDRVLVKPESQGDKNNQLDDFNNINETSIYNTGGNPKNKPIESSEGVLETIKGIKGKYQRWYGTSGIGKNRIFSRFDNGEWKEVFENNQKIEGTFEHHNETPKDLTQISKSGYYHTVGDETGFPPELKTEEDKIGIIKALVKDGNKYLEYIPFAGKHAGLEWKIVIGTKRDNILDEIWNKWFRSSHPGMVEIHQETKDQTFTPEQYAQHSNKNVIFEVRFSRTLGDDFGEQDGYVLLMTATLSGDSRGDAQTGQESVIIQVAFTQKHNKIKIRHAEPENGNWKGWGKWVDVIGSIQVTEDQIQKAIEPILVKMFNRWKDEHKKNTII